MKRTAQFVTTKAVSTPLTVDAWAADLPDDFLIALGRAEAALSALRLEALEKYALFRKGGAVTESKSEWRLAVATPAKKPRAKKAKKRRA